MAGNDWMPQGAVEAQSNDNSSAWMPQGATEATPDSVMKNIQSGQNPLDATVNQIEKHPFKANFSPAAETITGKSLEQQVVDSGKKTDFTPQQAEDYKKQWGQYPSDYNKLNVGDRFKATGASLVDTLTNPSTYEAGPALKLAGKGAEVVGKTFDSVKNGVANAILNPEFSQTQEAFKYGHDARRVLKTMPDIVGNDVNSSIPAVEAKIKETGQAIGDTMVNHPNANVKMDASDAILKPFDDRIAELNQQGSKVNSAVIKRLKTAREDLISNTDEEGNVNGYHNLTDMTPKELFDYRQSKIDPMTKYNGNPSDDATVNSAYQEAKSNIRKMTNQVMPELKPLNQDYGDLQATHDAFQNLAFKAQKDGLTKIGWKDLATAGLLKPVNRVKLAQWLYTAPKGQAQQAAQNIPGFSQAVKNSFGGAKNAELITTPKSISGPASNPGITMQRMGGLPEPNGATVRSGVNPNTPSGALPNPGNIPINQPGVSAPKGLTDRSIVLSPTARSGVNPKPIIGELPPAGSIPIKQGTDIVKPTVDSSPKYGTKDANVMYFKNKASRDFVPLHPAEEGKAAIKRIDDEVKSMTLNDNIAKTLNIKPEQVDHLRDIKYLLDSSENGTNAGVSYKGGRQGESFHWANTSQLPEGMKHITQKEMSEKIGKVLNGETVGKVTMAQVKMILKKLSPKT